MHKYEVKQNIPVYINFSSIHYPKLYIQFLVYIQIYDN